MTNAQRECVLKLRSDGLGYIRIAKQTGISENTIKSFCRRAACKSSNDGSRKHFCPQCGAEVEQMPGRKEKRFCSDKCRRNWWNAHSEKINRQKTHKHICLYCGREFETYGKRERKYCSHECYITARFGGGTANDR